MGAIFGVPNLPPQSRFRFKIPWKRSIFANSLETVPSRLFNDFFGDVFILSKAKEVTSTIRLFCDITLLDWTGVNAFTLVFVPWRSIAVWVWNEHFWKSLRLGEKGADRRAYGSWSSAKRDAGYIVFFSPRTLTYLAYRFPMELQQYCPFIILSIWNMGGGSRRNAEKMRRH